MAERVSIIVTVLNEGASLARLLDSLAAQTRLPDEFVVVDGGSWDNTVDVLESFTARAPFPVRVLVRAGANISQGRNLAIAEANGEIIAITDAGVRLDPDWLEKLVAPYDSLPAPDVVSGFFVPEHRNLFEQVLGATTLPRLDEISEDSFYPSSRSVAVRRSAWEAVGGYPEWLDYCEDLLFDFALRDAGFRFKLAPQACVHFRPRATLRAFLKQYYRYARGDGKADFWRYRHLLRYGTYLVALPLAAAAAAWHPVGWLALLGVLMLLAWMPVRRLWPELSTMRPWQRPWALIMAVGLRVAGDVAKMVGYPVGVVWRLRHGPRGSWPRRQW
ncbi:MAG: glycosyltransferase [Anaerolineae bacterium]|jgi:GT2 family glycosyltransferase|nr:glycosyltransferase [Chloroflexota bacterium]